MPDGGRNVICGHDPAAAFFQADRPDGYGVEGVVWGRRLVEFRQMGVVLT